MSLTTQYLFQVDVLIDDSLVPLRVDSLPCMLGLPLVFSTGGTHHNNTYSVNTYANRVHVGEPSHRGEQKILE